MRTCWRVPMGAPGHTEGPAALLPAPRAYHQGSGARGRRDARSGLERQRYGGSSGHEGARETTRPGGNRGEWAMSTATPTRPDEQNQRDGLDQLKRDASGPHTPVAVTVQNG